MQITESKYEKQMISVDISIFSIINNRLSVLLLKRNKEPFTGFWSLTGGGVYNDETCESAIVREMHEKIGIEINEPTLSYVFSDPKRDVRFRNISISFYSLINAKDFDIKINKEKISEYKWFDISDLPHLAFDHNQILQTAINQLREKIYDIKLIKNYLPESFTLGQLQTIYESILQTSLDKRNFRRKLNSLNCLEKTGEKNTADSHRKSEICKFKL